MAFDQYLSKKISIPNGLLGIKTKMGLFKNFTSVCVQLSCYLKLKSYKRGAKVKKELIPNGFHHSTRFQGVVQEKVVVRGIPVGDHFDDFLA